MKKKVITIALSLAMALTVLATPALAAENTNDNDQANNEVTEVNVADEEDGEDSEEVESEVPTTVEAPAAPAAPKSAEPSDTVEAADDLQASTTYNSVKLTWDEEDSAKTQIFRATNKNGKYKRVATLRVGKDNYTDKKIATGKTKYYKVVEAESGQVSASDLKQVPAIKATPRLAKPQVKAFKKTRRSVVLKWNKVKGAQKYKIYKFDGQSHKFKRIKTVGKNTTFVKQKKLEIGTTQKFKVAACITNKDATTSKTDSKVKKVVVPKKLTMQTKGFWATNNGKVIKKARTKLGCPYVWGASGPHVFDCSGFTSWTMKKSGKKLTGVQFRRLSSRGIYHKWKKYSVGRNLSKAQPADIIIIGHGGSASSIFHVGMYYNAGCYIHATTGGRGVTISRIPPSMVVAIIRLPGLR